MIPNYIIDSERKRQEQQEQDNRISLEIPDHSQEYMEWIRKSGTDKAQEQPETVIVIDIY